MFSAAPEGPLVRSQGRLAAPGIETASLRGIVSPGRGDRCADRNNSPRMRRTRLCGGLGWATAQVDPAWNPPVQPLKARTDTDNATASVRGSNLRVSRNNVIDFRVGR